MRAPLRSLLIKTLWRLHKYVYLASGGQVWGRIVGMPVLVLHTVGNKTGKARSNMLTYIPYGDDFLIAASNGGADSSPDWYRNLLAEPQVRIQVGRTMINAVARVTDGEERHALWAQFKQAYGGYHRYELRTDRVIPVIVVARQ